jgi:hypothetical protein
MGRGCFYRADPLIDDLKGMLEGYRENILKNRGRRSKSSRFAIHQKPDMIETSINSQKSQHRKVKNTGKKVKYGVY